MNSNWVVHKFGGTSVADAERYRAAAEIVLARAPGERTAVVVSAMSGVTNALIQSVELAASNNSVLSNQTPGAPAPPSRHPKRTSAWPIKNRLTSRNYRF